MTGPELDDRLALTRAMAARSGVTLETAVAPEAARRMAERCANCTKTETCRLALVTGQGEDLPGFCLNRETIETLSARR